MSDGVKMPDPKWYAGYLCRVDAFWGRLDPIRPFATADEIEVILRSVMAGTLRGAAQRITHENDCEVIRSEQDGKCDCPIGELEELAAEIEKGNP